MIQLASGPNQNSGLEMKKCYSYMRSPNASEEQAALPHDSLRVLNSLDSKNLCLHKPIKHSLVTLNHNILCSTFIEKSTLHKFISCAYLVSETISCYL